jgi:hypothetical protein
LLTINLSATDDHPAAKLTMEHSLLAISKWESIHEKAFFGKDEKTAEDMVDYMYCMLLNENPPPDFLTRLTKADYEAISNHINSSHTATVFSKIAQKPSQEIITSELMYYWMVQFKIPFHPTETWHVNRLFTLVQICGRKQEKPKKMSKQQIAQQYREINEQRRRESGSSG